MKLLILFFFLLTDRIVLNKRGGESKMATVIQADIPTTNGVLHIIDRLLNPQESHYVLV